MNKFFSISNTSGTINMALLIARLGIAALMLTHGIPKLGMLLSGEPVQFLPFMGLSAKFSLGLAVFAEVVCSVFLLVGFATRFATVPLIITMLVAVLMVHAADPFAMKEPGFQYLLVYVVLLLMGGGKYSVDYLLQPKTLRV